MKIDIGGGEHTKEGFVNVDRYHPLAGIMANVLNLPFGDNTIEEAYSKHTFEHLGKAEIRPALKEVYRVLMPKSNFTIIVPDLEWCVKNWLTSPKKLERSLDWIFGGQNNKGDFHKTGYTMETLSFLLEEVGFKIISKKTYLDYDFQALQIEVIKKIK